MKFRKKGDDIAGLRGELTDEFVQGVGLIFWRGGRPGVKVFVKSLRTRGRTRGTNASTFGAHTHTARLRTRMMLWVKNFVKSIELAEAASKG